MYSPFQLATRYAGYYLTASNSRGHGIHSPFVFHFIKFILNDRTSYPAYSAIENRRQEMRRDQRIIEVTDYGAGSGHDKSSQRKVSDIAKHALKSPRFAKLLYRIAAHYRPDIVVELGTSLGITTSYLASAVPQSRVITFEGSDRVAEIAAKNFRSLELENVELVTGPFEQTLPVKIAELEKVDLAFLDGNHRYQPTVEYFTMLLPLLSDHAIIILDDIHWSAGMEKAWEECRKHPSVTLSIDLFFIGILFFSKDFKIPQHFVIRF